MYKCKNHCHLSVKSGTCPRCGSPMLNMGNVSQEKALEDVRERQNSFRKDLPSQGGRIENQALRDEKRHFNNKEKLWQKHY